MSTRSKLKKFDISLSVDRKYCGEAMRAVLSTIMFLRLFGSLTPGTGESVGVTYPKIVNQDIEILLNNKVREVMQSCGEAAKPIEVRVEFFERRVKKTAWFAKTHNYCWESWNIGLSIKPPQSKPAAAGIGADLSDTATRKAASLELRQALMEIVSNADNYKEHIPPITTTDVAPFPYEIAIV